MADMTREEARKLVYDLTQYVDGQITSSEEIKAMEILIEDSKKLEAYENADLIERDKIYTPLETVIEAHKIGSIAQYGIRNIIRDLPRFNPERQVDNE